MSFPRFAPLVGLALLSTSCFVPPSCYDEVFGWPRKRQHLVSVTLFSGPVKGSVEDRSGGRAPWQRFENASSVRLYANGEMVVADRDLLPRRCPGVSRPDLERIARLWQPVFERTGEPRIRLRLPRSPDTAGVSRTGDVLLSLSVGPIAGKDLGLVWDGRVEIPEVLETAVLGTLETVCSNSRRVRREFLRDLPGSLVDRLDCLGE